MESHFEEAFCLDHEFAGKTDDEVGPVSTFGFLHLGSSSDHSRGGMVHFDFSDDGGCI